jgi:NAD-dependent deacetylase
MIRPLVEGLEQLEAGRMVIVTGAGISAASGIPTFRGSDPDAVWKHDVTELGTCRYFRRDPVGSWSWYLERFRHVLKARPNPGHLAIAALERWHLGRGGEFLLVTQNIDTLHEHAGSREMVKVHGSADRVRCASDGCRNGAPSGSLARSDVDVTSFLEGPSLQTVPRCPACNDLLRQHVLWFDEYYAGHDDYQWPRVQHAASSMDFLLFVGTSFAVGVTDLFLQLGLPRGIPVFSIDPGGASVPGAALSVLTGNAELLLPDVCKTVGAAMEQAGG